MASNFGQTEDTFITKLLDDGNFAKSNMSTLDKKD